MEVPPEGSNALPKRLIVSSVGLHIILPDGLILPRLTKLSLEGLSVSSGRIGLKYHT